MDHDDAQIGRILSRREALALFGAAGVSVFGTGYSGFNFGAAAGRVRPSCIVRPEQTEGPYFVEERLNRSDIRSDPSSGVVPEGVRLDLTFRVSQMTSPECKPLAGALVDVWQCDALGVYSDVRDTNRLFNTEGQKFLRGHQTTNADGTAEFVTIYPGWYQGRTVHIHFKIRTPREGEVEYDFTSQLYFDDDLTDHVLQREPYAQKGRRSIRNAQDGIYRRGGNQLKLAVSPREEHYAATFDIGLQLD